MTTDCLQIVHEAIAIVDPETAIRNHCQKVGQSILRIGSGATADSYSSTTKAKDYDLTDFDHVMVIAFGKASSGMASALVEVLVGDSSSLSLSGTVIVKDGHATEEQVAFLARHNIAVHEASHPVPDERSVQATRHILQSVQDAAAAGNNEKTLILVCISGGGSALFCAPHPRLTLHDLQTVNNLLLQSGLSIQEMNVIRKKLEVAKGGGLAMAAAATATTGDRSSGGNTTTKMVSLILSDVLGDPLDLIASGPTVRDPSTWSMAWNLVQQRFSNNNNKNKDRLPQAVLQLLQDGKDGKLPNDSVKQVVEEGQTCLVGNNELAVERAAQVAQQLGYRPIVLGTLFQGEAKDVANVLVAMAQQIQQGPSSLAQYSMGSISGKTSANNNNNNDKKNLSSSAQPIALIAGGETTVTLPPNCQGKGGRNQELALSAALALRQQRQASGMPPLRNIVVASVGTDGTDGPTDAAGAVVDGGTIARLSSNTNNNSSDGAAAAIQALQQHNAYEYLDQADAQGKSPLIRTGPTGTNVADVIVVLVGRG